ncbi:hypothetical protein [Corallococcus macrosporus]|uniref:Lipoprotein n=1 Tax=Corallococcus macrosporus DSM 14697 TaxID=1189310 RepID=A0A250JWP1_9BACT|nr:hypothetical protein [Corallococcus macrosporus]ATB48274.1 hypothetical protein MYMAC_003900 [Corallococcus macrosporus DSM 14697]
MRMHTGAWRGLVASALIALATACGADAPRDGRPGEARDAGPGDGGSPDAGEPTDGGEPEPTDGGPPPPPCADDNPCTESQVVAGQGCVHVPVPDGTTCDDANTCTSGDVCVAGGCQGTPVSRPPGTVSTVWSHGAEPIEHGTPPLEGLAEFVSEDRVLFGDRLGGGGLSLALARVGPEGLERLDQEVLDLYVERYFGSWDWSDRFLTFLVPLGPERVVVVGTRQRVELLGLEGDEVRRLSRYALPPTSDSVLAGVGRGERFWTCSGYYVTAWRVGPDDALTMDASRGITLPAPCRALALTVEGGTLWVATASGLVPVDVPADGPPVVRPAVLRTKAFYHLAVDQDFLVATELLRYGDLGGISVFRLAELEGATDPVPVKTFAPADGGVWARALGFALLDGALLVEWYRQQGATRRYVVERHALGPSGVSGVEDSLLLRESAEQGLLLSPLPLAGRGRFAVAQPWRRVLALEGTQGLGLRTGLHHGSLERVWAAPGGLLLAVGPFGSHRVGLSAAAPTLLAGGQGLPPDTQRLRLAPGRGGALALVTVPASRANVRQEEGAAPLSCLAPGPDGLLQPAGQVHLPGGPAALVSTPGQLFQLSPVDDSLRLRRFALPESCEGAALTPASERLFEPDPSGARTRKDWGLAVEVASGEALVGEAHVDGADMHLSLAWGRWDGAAEVATGTLPATTDAITALALARGRALVLENRRMLHVLARAGTRLVTERSVDLSRLAVPLDVTRILAFDGDVAWLATNLPTFGAVAVRVDAPDLPVARHDTPAPVRTLDVVGEHLLLGMNEALSSVAPACDASAPRVPRGGHVPESIH